MGDKTNLWSEELDKATRKLNLQRLINPTPSGDSAMNVDSVNLTNKAKLLAIKSVLVKQPDIDKS